MSKGTSSIRTVTTGRTAVLPSRSTCTSVIKHSTSRTYTSKSVGCKGELPTRFMFGSAVAGGPRISIIHRKATRHQQCDTSNDSGRPRTKCCPGGQVNFCVPLLCLLTYASTQVYDRGCGPICSKIIIFLEQSPPLVPHHPHHRLDLASRV